ncbi:MAG: MFS transporter [Clostridia bacterium]|nr:MFS transporter [Clostridia bacterium]
MKNSKKLAILCALVYFISYVTRINYAASLAEIVADLGITKSLASIAVTGSFITYAIGQIISGIIGDKFDPRKVIAFGIVGTSAINISVFFLEDIGAINALWCFNGLFQALLWPPLLRFVSLCFDRKAYSRVVVLVSQASYVATILVYVTVPVIITVSNWHTVFAVCGALGATFAVVWFFGTKNINLEESAPVKKTQETDLPEVQPLSLKKILAIGMVPMVIASVSLGILKEGITTWMPSYVSEVFNLGSAASILSTAILPVFNIIMLVIIHRINRYVQNESMGVMLFFGVALTASVVLTAVFSKAVILDVVLMSLISSSMHGNSYYITCQVPHRFLKYGRVSTVSGVFNACIYLGAAISTYAFAGLTEAFGWNFTVISWGVIALLGVLLGLISYKPWKRFIYEK